MVWPPLSSLSDSPFLFCPVLLLVPYFPDIWTELGYGALVQQFGANGTYLWDYDNSFRALIFKRDAPNVNTINDMKTIMRWNRWQTDPLSRGSAELAIAARNDLSSGPLEGTDPSGAIDCKISSYSMMSFGTLTVLAQSGPTLSDGAQPPFQWSTSPFNDMPHLGLPDLFNFEWQVYVPAVKPSTIAHLAERPSTAVMTE